MLTVSKVTLMVCLAFGAFGGDFTEENLPIEDIPEGVRAHFELSNPGFQIVRAAKARWRGDVFIRIEGVKGDRTFISYYDSQNDKEPVWTKFASENYLFESLTRCSLSVCILAIPAVCGAMIGGWFIRKIAGMRTVLVLECIGAMMAAFVGVMIAIQVAVIIQYGHPACKLGDHALEVFGWVAFIWMSIVQGVVVLASGVKRLISYRWLKAGTLFLAAILTFGLMVVWDLHVEKEQEEFSRKIAFRNAQILRQLGHR